MKKYLIVLSVLAFVACNNSKSEEEMAIEAVEHEKMIQQRAIDSMTIVNLKNNQGNTNSSSANTTNNSEATSAEPEGKKVLNVLLPKYLADGATTSFVADYKLGHRVGDGVQKIMLKLL